MFLNVSLPIHISIPAQNKQTGVCVKMRAKVAGKTELLIFSSVKFRGFTNLKGNFTKINTWKQNCLAIFNFVYKIILFPLGILYLVHERQMAETISFRQGFREWKFTTHYLSPARINLVRFPLNPKNPPKCEWMLSLT